MGHEKKKRKKDRDSDRKRHRHSSGDSPTDVVERSRKKHKKHKSHKRRRDYESPSQSIETSPPAVRTKVEQVLEEQPPLVSPVDGSEVADFSGARGGDASLSIDETNALRAQLGLKPLQVGASESAGDKNDNDGGTDAAPTLGSSDTYAIHKRPENIGDKKRTEKLREKLASRRKQRELEQKLASSRQLGTVDSDDESASAWIEKSRRMQKEKEEASKRAALLDDLDAEFGVGSLVDEEQKISTAAAYSSADLVGLQVAHDSRRLAEGRDVVLTLEDRNVLDEEVGDTLVNVNMVDDERHEKNVQLRRKKVGYCPEENEEWDEEGNFVQRSLLSQYDEELSGPKRNIFTIGRSSAPESTSSTSIPNTFSHLLNNRQSSAAQIQKMLREKTAQSLQLAAPKIASDFFTEEEMTKFKRVRKKVRKVRKKVRPLKADDLLPLADDPSEHLGRRGGRSSDVEVKPEPHSDPETILETDDTVAAPELSGVKLEALDDSDLQVREAMERSKRLREIGVNVKSEGAGSHEERLLTIIKQESGSHDGVDQHKTSRISTETTPAAGHIVLNTTAEFCRSLGDIPTYGLAGNREGEGDDLVGLERELAEERAAAAASSKSTGEGGSGGGAWAEVGGSAAGPSSDADDDLQETSVILEQEPVVGSGMAGALQLAVKKGYVESESTARKGVSQQVLSHLRAKNYSIDDKSGADDERGRRGRGSTFYNGPVSDFNEKRNYRPEIQLDYVDDQGRALSSKEAFRYLSHKFHGKGSGKIKTEKREKKFKEERLMAQMTSTDTPLSTLSRLQEKQKQLQSPFVVLSGNSLLNAPASLTAEK